MSNLYKSRTFIGASSSLQMKRSFRAASHGMMRPILCMNINRLILTLYRTPPLCHLISSAVYKTIKIYLKICFIKAISLHQTQFVPHQKPDYQR